ncbi:MAG: hypothetical protein NTV89_13735, partial [Proteobacteria bacterium]|nr:hypothetical protein [Pseudomonadota bacterium]
GKPDLKKIEEERAAINTQVDRLQEKSLSKEQKKKILEQIHKDTSKQPVTCNECHSRKNPFIPLIDIGYPKERAAMVTSDQITKMIDQYEVFHTPKFLEPERQPKK